MRRSIFVLAILPIALAGCGGPPADPSLDPKSAIVDPSKVKPVTDSMRKDAEAGSLKTVPSFSLTAHTGRTYSEKSLQGKATVIYFLHTDCPCCVDANPFFNQLAEAYPDQVISISNGNLAKSEIWAKANDAKFPILADESKKTISAFGAKFGVVTALVDATGMVVKLIPGYSRGEFEEMSEFLAEGKEPKKLDWSKAPAASTAGCQF